jgi:superfamily I DNA/RNA helicase
VFWLNSSLCPAKWARQDWQKQQEVNLCYVAATRAMSELHLIEEKKDEQR